MTIEYAILEMDPKRNSPFHFIALLVIVAFCTNAFFIELVRNITIIRVTSQPLFTT